MIVDLNLQGKTVLVVGGGKEAEKRIKFLEGCKIIVISKKITNVIRRQVKSKKLDFKKVNISRVSILSKYSPDMVITTTDDSILNSKILDWCKKYRVIGYSSDDPESSDFSNGSVIDFDNTVKIAIFTGGKSPAMSKEIRTKAEKVFKKLISKEEIGQIRIQQIARKEAKRTLPTQKERKLFLNKVLNDKGIKQLIKEGKMKKAENRAISLLGERNE